MNESTEQIALEIDEAPAVAAVGRANQALDNFEKRAKQSNQGAGRAFEQMGGLVVRTADNTLRSVERLTTAWEKQALVFGRSPIDRIIAQRDQLIQRLGNEKAHIDRVTAAAEKMIAVERQMDGGSGGRGFNINYGIRGIKDVFEGRGTFALAELTNELMVMKGAALAVAGTATGIGLAGVAIYELRKHLTELGEAPHRAAVALGELNAATRTHNDELQKQNDRLADTIAQIEKKPRNLLAEALDEARLSADRLAESLNKDLEGLSKLVKDNSVGIFGRVMGHAGTGDIENWVERYQSMVRDLNFAGSENVHRATTKSGADSAQAEWDRALASARGSARARIADWIARAEAASPAGKGSIFEQDDDPSKRATRLALLRGIATNLNLQGDFSQLEDRNRSLVGQEARAREIEKARTATEQLRQDLTHARQADLNGIEKVNQAYEERLRKLREEGQATAVNLALAKQIRDVEIDRFEKADRRATDRASFSARISIGEAGLRQSLSLYRAGRRASGAAFGVEDVDQEYGVAMQIAQSQFGLASGHVQDMRATGAAPGEIVRAQIEAAKNFALAAMDAVARRKESLIDLTKQQRDEEEKTTRAGYENERRLTDALDGDRAGTMRDALQRRIRRAQALSDPTALGQLRAASLVEGLRVEGARSEFGFAGRRLLEQMTEASAQAGGARTPEERRQWEGEITRLKVEGIRVVGDLQREIDDAHQDRVLKVIEIQRQQMEGLKQEAAGLLHTLFTAPGQFPRQLFSTVRDSALRPIERGLGGLIAGRLKPLIFGQDGSGGLSGALGSLFGGGSDPVRLSTDLNTQATLANTAALGGLTMAMSGGFAGGGITGLDPAGVSGRMTGIGGWLGGAGSGGGLGTTAAGVGAGGDGGLLGGVAATLGHGPLSKTMAGILRQQRLMGALQGVATMAGLGMGYDGVRRGGGLGIAESAAGGAMVGFGIGGVGGIGMGLGIGLGAGLVGDGIRRGGVAGIGEDVAGGALIGGNIGGPLGAAIGAGAGLLAGIVRLFVKGKLEKTRELIRTRYGVDVQSKSILQQIVAIADQGFGGNLEVAAGSSQVREIVRLYAQTTGQRSGLVADTVHGASLAETGGRLYQTATYDNGQAYTYGSGLPTLGPAGSTLPTASPFGGNPVVVQVSPEATADLWRTGTAAAIQGDPRGVSSAAARGASVSSSRFGLGSALAPGYIAG